MKKLTIVWSFLDLCLLSAGVLCIVSAILFSQPQHLISALIKTRINFQIIGICLGSTYIFGTLLSLPAILSSVENSKLLMMLNWWLVILASLTLAFGSYVWMFSLQQISEFFEIWSEQSENVQQTIQDKFSCCGYFNGTSAGGLTTQLGFCTDSTFAANQTGCSSKITSAQSPGSDYTLENIFTSIYGFEVIIGLFFLATVCVINERNITVRFKRIDEKRGGGGFV
ncbi:hypothetical protein L486_03100 [Kwoniella mangroviensis CBS 10435]|uniref:Tetraspanin n=1 Tax=Kwoniella mangroviensis CBS 10435 TaxID=1331196 RepID=A0A1B9ISU4_9TREE|nr:uncharacterized protein I203_01785 [Kwoniella mangroviensis CBS 8507]OCF58611.1 hypothetical protein L486_03100 [Kwoniella mangroviensis CBS 10435]OCF68403.1 hypothetical protein I203_01785 [Kwoniella mangroviensis CBS 8507]